MDSLVEGTLVGQRTEEALLDEVRAIRAAVDAIRQALAAPEQGQPADGAALATSIIALPDGSMNIDAGEPGPERTRSKREKRNKARQRRKK